jgi:hypothetical protein
MTDESRLGQWKVVISKGASPAVCDLHDKPIATIHGAGRKALSNASLVASAPALLEATKAALDVFRVIAKRETGTASLAAQDMIPSLESVLSASEFLVPSIKSSRTRDELPSMAAASRDVAPLREVELGEIAVQRAFTELLQDSREVRERFLRFIRATEFSEGSGGQFIRARRSVLDKGETDVQLEWQVDSSRLRVLVEVKLLANFGRLQVTNYLARVRRARDHGLATRLVLVAPREYFKSANADIHHFEFKLPFEQILEWADCSLIRETLDRLAGKRPLGAKGLFRNLHEALARGLQANGLPFRITNKATDWVFLDHPACGKGVRLRYRIRDGIAELRLNRSFGKVQISGAAVPPFITRRAAGSETIFRHNKLRVSDAARLGSPTDNDIGAICSALNEITEWWRSRGKIGAKA